MFREKLQYSTFALYLLFCHRIPLTRSRLCPLCTVPSNVYTLMISRAFSSPSWTVPILPAFPHRRDAPVPWSPLCPFTEFSLVCLCLFYTGEPRTRCITPNVASALWMEGKDHPPWAAGNTSNEAQDTTRLLCCKDTLVAHVPPGTYQDPPGSFFCQMGGLQYVLVHGGFSPR